MHASAVAFSGQGVLLAGRPGSGKSITALACIEHYGAVLVADDMVCVKDGMLKPSPGWEGALEVRGVGIIRLPYEANIPLVCAITLIDDEPERLPRHHWFNCEKTIRHFYLQAGQPSLALKVLYAWRSACLPEYEWPMISPSPL